LSAGDNCRYITDWATWLVKFIIIYIFAEWLNLLCFVIILRFSNLLIVLVMNILQLSYVSVLVTIFMTRTNKSHFLRIKTYKNVITIASLCVNVSDSKFAAFGILNIVVSMTNESYFIHTLLKCIFIVLYCVYCKYKLQVVIWTTYRLTL